MIKADLYNQNREKIGEVELKDSIFGEPRKLSIVHEYVRWLMARKRAGTASTKTRGEVSGGGRKPWRQKGTGRARHGSIRAPQWKGGGVVFGPKPRDYAFDLPKKIRRKALRIALSDRFREGKLFFVDEIKLGSIKTKDAYEIAKRFEALNSTVVVDDKDEVLVKSFRNIPKVDLLRWDELNAYEVLKRRVLIITKGALDKIQERWG